MSFHVSYSFLDMQKLLIAIEEAEDLLTIFQTQSYKVGQSIGSGKVMDGWLAILRPFQQCFSHFARSVGLCLTH